jgi:hypothetical protein
MPSYIPNPYESTIKELPNIFGNWNPMTYLKQMDQQGLADQWNNVQLQGQQEDLSQTKAMNPLLQQKQQISNLENLMQVPGHAANSSMLMDKAKISNDTLDAHIQDVLKGYKFADQKRELDQLNATGQALAQAAPLIAGWNGAPGAAHATAKRLLGSMYPPELDQIPPQHLSTVMGDIGNSMMSASQKYQQAIAPAQIRADALRDVAEVKTNSAEDIAKYKAALSEKLATMKVVGQDPKNYQAAATALLLKANQEKDPEMRQELLKHAQEFSDLHEQGLAIRAQANQAGKPDVSALAGIPVQPGPQRSIIPGAPQVQPPGPPRSTPQSKIPGVKPGYVALFKDGKPVGQVPAEQAQQAQAQGYEVK